MVDRAQSRQGGARRISDFRFVGAFTPWWVECRECAGLATMQRDWDHRTCGCKCKNCGAIYQITMAKDYSRSFVEIPFWLKANFRGEVLWPVNGEHLYYL